jgi:hypothetical protein
VGLEIGPATASTAPLPAPPPGMPALDDTAESPLDVNALAAAVSQRTELLMLAQQSEQQQLQLRLDRMRAHFNASQERRAELLREANALRDMAIEQAKKDDEILKKYIAMI